MQGVAQADVETGSNTSRPPVPQLRPAATPGARPGAASERSDEDHQEIEHGRKLAEVVAVVIGESAGAIG